MESYLKRSSYVKLFWIVVLFSQCFRFLFRVLAFLYGLLAIGTIFSFTVNTMAVVQLAVTVFTTFICFRIHPYPCDKKQRFKMKIYRVFLWACSAISKFARVAVYLFVITSEEKERTIRAYYFGQFSHVLQGNAVTAFEIFWFYIEFVVTVYFCDLFIIRYSHLGYRTRLLTSRLPSEFLQMRRSEAEEYAVIRKIVSKYMDCNAMAQRIFCDYCSVYFVWVSGFVVEVIFTVNWLILVPQKTHTLTLCLVVIFAANFMLIWIAVDVSSSVDNARVKMSETIRDYQLARLLLTGKTSNTCHSIKILADLVVSNRFAMSGMGFFYVDRAFLCKISGVLFTYSGLAYQFSYSAPAVYSISEGYYSAPSKC